MAKRRKRGTFDPDYRRKGWRESGFAPKNSSMGITELAGTVTFLLFFGLYLIPEFRPVMFTLRGVVIAGVGAFIFWVILSLLIRRWAWRRVRPKPESPLTFDNVHSPQAKADTPKAPAPQPEAVKINESTEMSPRDFEHEVAWLVNVLTDFKAVVVGGAGDGGTDVRVYDGDRLVGIMQCKKYSNPISPNHIRDLAGARALAGVETAYLVTTGTISKAARRTAKSLNIKLIDGNEFERKRAEANQRLKAIAR